MNETVTGDVMQSLIDACRDAEHAYRLAAAATTDAGTLQVLLSLADQHAAYAEELAAVARRVGVDVAARGGVDATLRRGHANLRVAVHPRDQRELLAAAARAEAATLDRYDMAVRGAVSERVRAVVVRQRDALQEGQRRLSRLAA